MKSDQRLAQITLISQMNDKRILSLVKIDCNQEEDRETAALVRTDPLANLKANFKGQLDNRKKKERRLPEPA
jgi:P pilus assembly chaperone PapD